MFIISGVRTPRGIGIICGLSNGSFALPVFSASSPTIRTTVLRKGSPGRIPPVSHYKLIRRNHYSIESSLNQGFGSQKRPKNFKLLQDLRARITSTASKLPPGSQGSHSFGSRFSHNIQSSYYFHPRTWFTSGIILLASAAAFTAMSARDFIALTDAESLDAFCPEDDVQLEIESFINSHPLTKSLRQNPSFTESRPSLKINESYRSSSLTSGVLSGPGKIVVPPFAWSEEGGKSLVSIFYLGSDLCGHPGIVHGGLLATLLDEGLAKCCFPALPNRIGMTANLTINYRRPSPASSFVVLRAKTVKVEGRKAWVEGHIETLVKEGEKPVILVEATALMIEPKQAKMLQTLIPVPV